MDALDRLLFVKGILNSGDSIYAIMKRFLCSIGVIIVLTGCGSDSVAEQVTPSSQDTVVDQGTPDPWGEAVRNAIQAAELAQSAHSTDQWAQVESLWNQASSLMSQVPNSHPEFATAQQKVGEYSQNAQIAQQHNATAQQLQDERCGAVRSVVINQLRIDGWVNADLSNFAFSCSDNGTELIGEYSLGQRSADKRSFVALKAQSSSPVETLQYKPLSLQSVNDRASIESARNNSSVSWESW